MSEHMPIHRPAIGAFRWADVAPQPYKQEGDAPFRAVERHTLFADPDMPAHLRYFEIGPGGYSTLERHAHTHCVMILRGRGRCLVGESVFDVAAHDLVSVPPWAWHQFRATAGEALGFLCLVDAQRDRPQTPGADELAALRAVPAVAAFLADYN